jgi:thiopeptide-type bacteriocin biosynthesis protein
MGISIDRESEFLHDRAAIPADLLAAQVPLGGRTARLADVLRFCLDGDPGLLGNGVSQHALAEQCRIFLSGGLQAMRRPAHASRWTEFSLVLPGDDPGAQVYKALKDLVDDLSDAGELACFFFLHQAPGLRVRFQAFGANQPALHARLQSWLADWQRKGLVPRIREGLYEPETATFGGPLSMAFVHRLFTLDSRAWLAVHAREGADDMDSDWAISIGMLAAQLGALGIPREDGEVWERVRSRVARAHEGELSIRDEPTGERDLADFASDVRAVWTRPEWIDAVLSAGARAIVKQFALPATNLIHNWNGAYFETPQAVIGPREAAAQLTVQHWNRARLPLDRQLVFAQALASGRDCRGR